MNKTELSMMATELTDLQDQIDILTKKAEALKDAIKKDLTRRNKEEIEVDGFIIRWTSYTSEKFDSVAFKKANESLYKKFKKIVSSRRFSVVRA